MIPWSRQKSKVNLRNYKNFQAVSCRVTINVLGQGISSKFQQNPHQLSLLSLLSLRWTRTIWAVDGSSQQPRSDVQSRLISRWSCAVVGWEGHVSSSYRTSDPLKYKVSIQIWKMIRHDHLILWYLRSNSKRKCMNLYDVYILVSYHSGKFLLFEHVDCIYISYCSSAACHPATLSRWSSCQDVRVNSMLQQTSQAIRLPKTHSFVNWCQSGHIIGGHNRLVFKKPYPQWRSRWT